MSRRRRLGEGDARDWLGQQSGAWLDEKTRRRGEWRWDNRHLVIARVCVCVCISAGDLLVSFWWLACIALRRGVPAMMAVGMLVLVRIGIRLYSGRGSMCRGTNLESRQGEVIHCRRAQGCQPLACCRDVASQWLTRRGLLGQFARPHRAPRPLPGRRRRRRGVDRVRFVERGAKYERRLGKRV